MIYHKRDGRLSQIIFLFFIFLMQNQWMGCAFSQEPKTMLPEKESFHHDQSQHIPGRLIVKLTPKASDEIAKARGDQKNLSSEKLPIEVLRRLSQKNRIASWQPLFPKVVKDDSTGLSRIYLLSCDSSTDILAVAQAFSRISELVEYAEPDLVVDIQQKSGQ